LAESRYLSRSSLKLHSQQYLKEYDSQFVKTAEICSLVNKAIVESPFVVLDFDPLFFGFWPAATPDRSSSPVVQLSSI